MTVWTFADCNWDLIRDDTDAAEILIPYRAWRTPEAAMGAAEENYLNYFEGVDLDGLDDNDKPVPIVWRKVRETDEWVAEVDGTLWLYRVYPIAVED